MQALHVWDKLNLVTLTLGADDLTRITTDLRPLATANPPEHGLTIFLPRPGPPLAEVVRSSLEWVDRRDGWRSLDRARDVLSGGTVESKVAWDDFAQRSAEYYTLLSQLVDLNLDGRAEAGNLPNEIVARVHAQPLDESLSRVSLRGYQSFGARFSLVQRRVIVGDEMGLGKDHSGDRRTGSISRPHRPTAGSLSSALRVLSSTGHGKSTSEAHCASIESMGSIVTEH